MSEPQSIQREMWVPAGAVSLKALVQVPGRAKGLVVTPFPSITMRAAFWERRCTRSWPGIAWAFCGWNRSRATSGPDS